MNAHTAPNHAIAPQDLAPATAEPFVLRQDDGPVTILTLNRPAARNSLSDGMLGALAAQLTAIAAESTIRAVILAANGPGFCAGHDLKEVTAHRADADRGRAFFAHIMQRCSGVMQQIVHLSQPVIASVHGIATAAGCQLVASCDLAVAGAHAKFATPGVNIGLFCSTPMVALSRNVAPKHAMELLLTGEMVSADDAFRMGLVNRVTPAGGEREQAVALARQIAAKSGHTVKIGKEAFYRQAEMKLSDAYNYASQVMVENMLARDAEEGIGAFIDKREPKWENR